MSLAHRQELVGSLLAGKVSDATIAFAKRAVAARQNGPSTRPSRATSRWRRRREEPNRGDRMGDQTADR